MKTTPDPEVARAAEALLEAPWLLDISIASGIITDTSVIESPVTELDYSCVHFPGAVAWSRRPPHLTPDWHVYLASEPWDYLAGAGSMQTWLDSPVDEEDGEHRLGSALLATFALCRVGLTATRSPWMQPYIAPTEPDGLPVLCVGYRWQDNGITAFVSEAPALWLPGAAQFHTARRRRTR